MKIKNYYTKPDTIHRHSLKGTIYYIRKPLKPQELALSPGHNCATQARIIYHFSPISIH